MSLEEISSVFECWEMMAEITSRACPPQNGSSESWACKHTNLSNIPPDVTDATPGGMESHESPFPYVEPWSFLGYEAFRHIKASEKSLRKELPMVLNGITVVARHDSSASGNFMSKELTSILNLKVDQNSTNKSTFILGNGKIIESIGKVHANCKFAQDLTTDINCSFNVLAKMSASLIMGTAFLEESETLSKNRHRLRKRAATANGFPAVNRLETAEHKGSKRYFICEINGRKTLTNPDSASDLDLMSPEYASKYGFELMGNGTQIQLADTSCAFTSGKILATLGLADGRKFLKFFDVLPGLDSDALLGEDTLGSIEAFTRLQGSFIDVALDEEPSELKIVVARKTVKRFLTRGRSRTASTTVSNNNDLSERDSTNLYGQVWREESCAEENLNPQSPHQYCRSQQAKASSRMSQQVKISEVLFLGGSPFVSTEEFLATTTHALDKKLRRIPDGNSYPALPAKIIKSQEHGTHTADGSAKIYTLQDIELTGYDDRAIASYAKFRSLKNTGVIPLHVRFQVSLPTPLSVVALSIKDKQLQAQIERLYETRILEALQSIQASIPASDLAIQWDLLDEVVVLEHERNLRPPHQRRPLPGTARIFERLARLAAAVDSDAEVGFNIYVGDSHRVRFEPRAATVSLLESAVEIGNEIAQESQLKHHVEYIHLSVPTDAMDKAHFKPLEDLKLQDIKLFMGVVDANNEPETRKRLEAAHAVCPNIAGVGVISDLSNVTREEFDRVLEVCASLTSR